MFSILLLITHIGKHSVFAAAEVYFVTFSRFEVGILFATDFFLDLFTCFVLGAFDTIGTETNGMVGCTVLPAELRVPMGVAVLPLGSD